jgi:hypothetical protein
MMTVLRLIGARLVFVEPADGRGKPGLQMANL